MTSMGKNLIDTPSREFFRHRSFRIEVKYSGDKYGNFTHVSVNNCPSKIMAMLQTGYNLDNLAQQEDKARHSFRDGYIYIEHRNQNVRVKRKLLLNCLRTSSPASASA